MTTELLVRFPAAVALFFSVSCGEARSDGTCAERHAVVRGRSESELATDDERRAVVALVEPEHGAFCSGFFVEQGWVLTARHCVEGAPLESVTLLDDVALRGPASTCAGRKAGTFDVIRSHLSETADLALLEVRRATPLETPALVTALVGNVEDWPRAEVAGFGRDADGHNGRLGFMPVTIEALADGYLRVAARSLGGACEGDSGGPLWGLTESGELRALGALHSGSADCSGDDRYTPLGDVPAWLAELRATPG